MTVALAIFLAIVVATTAAIMVRRALGDQWTSYGSSRYDDGWDESAGGVREPRRPSPQAGAAAVALPEPDEDA